MNKPLKIGLIVVGVLIALFVTAAVILVATVDPNAYKAEIAQAVKEETGRELKFEGDIGFNFFPWLGLKVGPVALGNAPGFSPAEMLRINRAEANIQIMPLLSGQIAIGTVVLDGFTMNLAVNQQGVTNWDDLAKGGKEDTAEKVEDTKQDHGGGGSQLESLSVEGVEITNANIAYDDRKTGKQAALNNFNLIIGEVGNKIPTPIEMHFDLKLNEPKIETKPALTAIATFDKDAGTVQLTNLILELLNLNITGDFFAKTGDKGVNYSGELKVAAFNAKTLMEQLGMEPLKTTDPAALTKISALLKIDGNDNAVSMDNLTVKLDDTTITGTGGVKNFAKPAITVAVNVDDIDADRYFPPPSDQPAAAQAEPTAEQEAPAEEPDLTGLKDLDLFAKLTIGKAKAMNLRVSDILVETRAKNGIVTTKPFKANLYEGTIDAHSVLDATMKVASWKEAAHLKNVQAGPLLKDLMGKDQLLGTTVVKYDVSGTGLTPDNIKKTISGTASFAFTDGAINGLNIAQMIRNAFSVLKGGKGKEDGPLRTDFAELLGSAQIDKGHITNNDLLMKSPLLRVTGKGWANLPRNEVDYLTTVTVVGTLKGQDGASMEDLSGLPIPLYAKGSLDDPKIGLDTKALADALFKGTFKKGTKGLEDTLKKNILGGGSDSGTTDTKEEKKTPGSLLKGLF